MVERLLPAVQPPAPPGGHASDLRSLEVIEMDDFITDEIVRNERVRRMTETEHCGRRLLQTRLRHIPSSFWGH